MTWQTDMGDNAPLQNQQQFQLPVRVAVPMEELEARASRFVSQQEESMENDRLLSNSNKVHLSQVEDRLMALSNHSAWISRVALEERYRKLAGDHLAPPSDPTNPTVQE